MSFGLRSFVWWGWMELKSILYVFISCDIVRSHCWERLSAATKSRFGLMSAKLNGLCNVWVGQCWLAMVAILKWVCSESGWVLWITIWCAFSKRCTKICPVSHFCFESKFSGNDYIAQQISYTIIPWRRKFVFFSCCCANTRLNAPHHQGAQFSTFITVNIFPIKCLINLI